MNTPIALIVFNRPNHTARVFEKIKRAKPEKLFLIADGPRKDVPQDAEKCRAVRSIIEGIDWDCEVFRNYSPHNLGCGHRPASGISWVFQHVDRAIILEDDCVPHPTFFRFCEELLEKFAHDERIMMIGGRNHLNDQNRLNYSYYFSFLPTCWGWATWARAWQHFDISIPTWSILRKTSLLQDMLVEPQLVEYWRKLFDQTLESGGEVDYWDYQWTFACWSQHGLCALPSKNLVSNIGFGEDATHTKARGDYRAAIPMEKLKFPLNHPPFIVRDSKADQIRFRQIISARYPNSRNHFYRRLKRKISRVMNGLL